MMTTQSPSPPRGAHRPRWALSAAVRPWRPAAALALALLACRAEATADTVRGVMQPRPGAAPVEMAARIHRVPDGFARAGAGEVRLDDDDIVLGAVIDGKPVAWPIRYLGMTEVANDRVGDVAVAPTW